MQAEDHCRAEVFERHCRALTQAASQGKSSVRGLGFCLCCPRSRILEQASFSTSTHFVGPRGKECVKLWQAWLAVGLAHQERGVAAKFGVAGKLGKSSRSA